MTQKYSAAKSGAPEGPAANRYIEKRNMAGKLIKRPLSEVLNQQKACAIFTFKNPYCLSIPRVMFIRTVRISMSCAGGFYKGYKEVYMIILFDPSNEPADGVAVFCITPAGFVTQFVAVLLSLQHNVFSPAPEPICGRQLAEINRLSKTQLFIG